MVNTSKLFFIFIKTHNWLQAAWNTKRTLKDWKMKKIPRYKKKLNWKESLEKMSRGNYFPLTGEKHCLN